MNALEQKIRERMDKRLKNLFSGIAIALSYDNSGYYIAGNSCNAAAPNDYDLYPLKGEDFNFEGIRSRVESVNGFVICETKNALTCNISGKVVQFCKYKKESLYKLVESFDFAHIQIGCRVHIEWRPGDFEDDPGGYESSNVDEVAYTPDWEQAHLLETTRMNTRRIDMGLARLSMRQFGSAEELCNFVNGNQISVIEQIVIKDNLYVLFYR